MKLCDIKIGDNYKQINRKTENIVIEPLPSFCNSRWKIATDLDNNVKEHIYVLTIANVITEITPYYNVAVNIEEANSNLEFILNNA